jgi:hypothetical protein
VCDIHLQTRIIFSVKTKRGQALFVCSVFIRPNSICVPLATITLADGKSTKLFRIFGTKYLMSMYNRYLQ